MKDDEIIKLLIEEFEKFCYKNTQISKVYYNEIMGDTSFLLAALLQKLMEDNFEDWDKEKWINDSLLEKVLFEENKLIISGVMIWGIENTDEQWTAPFIFKILHRNNVFDSKKFEFLFVNKDHNEISYEEFKVNRKYWSLQDNENWRFRIHNLS